MRRISLPELPKSAVGSIPPRSPTVTLSPAPLLPLQESDTSALRLDTSWSDTVSPSNELNTIESKESKYSTLSGSSGSVGPSGGDGIGRRGKGKPRLDQCSREKRRRKIAIIIAVTAAALLIMSILLVAVSLKLTPAIDEKIRKENADLLRKIQPSGTINGVQDNANFTRNVTMTSSTHTPGTSEG